MSEPLELLAKAKSICNVNVHELFEYIPWTSHMLSAARVTTIKKERIKSYKSIKFIKEGICIFIYINICVFYICVYIHVYTYIILKQRK